MFLFFKFEILLWGLAFNWIKVLILRFQIFVVGFTYNLKQRVIIRDGEGTKGMIYFYDFHLLIIINAVFGRD